VSTTRTADRFDRDGTAFEYLCKACHGEYCHFPRDGPETAFVRADAGAIDGSQYVTLVENE
jgi:hypothetical protein